jgi:hypothetical protein
MLFVSKSTLVESRPFLAEPVHGLLVEVLTYSGSCP